MKTSPTIFTSEAAAGRRFADLQLAWLDAADDACEAYTFWQHADPLERDDAFVVYWAALVREEAASRMLERHVKRADHHRVSGQNVPGSRRANFSS